MRELNSEQTAFFAKMETTFQTPGWELLLQGWKEEQSAIPEDAFFNSNTIEDLQNKRLRYQLLQELINLPDKIGQQKEFLMNPPDEEAGNPYE